MSDAEERGIGIGYIYLPVRARDVCVCVHMLPNLIKRTAFIFILYCMNRDKIKVVLSCIGHKVRNYLLIYMNMIKYIYEHHQHP